MKRVLDLNNNPDEKIEKLKEQYGQIELYKLPVTLMNKWCNLNPENYIDICNEINSFIEDNFIDLVLMKHDFNAAVVYLIKTNEIEIEEGDIEFLYPYSEKKAEIYNGWDQYVKTDYIFKGWFKYL